MKTFNVQMNSTPYISFDGSDQSMYVLVGIVGQEIYLKSADFRNEGPNEIVINFPNPIYFEGGDNPKFKEAAIHDLKNDLLAEKSRAKRYQDQLSRVQEELSKAHQVIGRVFCDDKALLNPSVLSDQKPESNGDKQES